MSKLSTSSKVKIGAPQSSPDKHEIMFVEAIHGAIEIIRCDRRSSKFGMIPTEKNVWIAHKEPNATTLEAFFLSAAVKLPRCGPILPWKYRMLLALTLFSTLLQLYRLSG
jgi:hypothetical protein